MTQQRIFILSDDALLKIEQRRILSDPLECSLIELEHNVGCATDADLHTESVLQHNVVCNEAFSQS